MTEEQERILAVLLDTVIPASADGRLPSACDVGFVAYMKNQGLEDWVAEGLQKLSDAAQGQFSQLDRTQQIALIEQTRRKNFRFFGDLASQIMQCYYMDANVLTAIGLEARAPFPIGFNVLEGDYSLLEPVYERGKCYRDAGGDE